MVSNMNFISECKKLIDYYCNDIVVRNNGTILLSSDGNLFCKHMFYRGVTDELLNALVKSYSGSLPKSYTDFLRFSNGANLYWVTIKADTDIKFSQSMLNIYGIPSKQPCKYEEEPFDIRLEDLSRHRQTPDFWLKIGSYILPNDPSCSLHDLFIDVYDLKVYSCIKNQLNIDKIWNDLDECLCELFELLSKAEEIIELEHETGDGSMCSS